MWAYALDGLKLGHGGVGAKSVLAGLTAGVYLEEGTEGAAWMVADQFGFDGLGMLHRVNGLDDVDIGHLEQLLDLVALDRPNEMPFNVRWQLT